MPQRILVAAMLLGGVLGCDDGASGVCPGNRDDVPDLIVDDADLATFWVGSLGVNALNKVGAGAESNTLVQANFNDFMEYRVFTAERVSHSVACEVYTGQAVRLQRCIVPTCDEVTAPCPEGLLCRQGTCRPTWRECTSDAECPGELICEEGVNLCLSPLCPEQGDCPAGYECGNSRAFGLDVSSVTFGGLAGGDVVLAPDVNHNIPPEVLDAFAYEDDSVTIEVASAGGEWDFPAFSTSLPAPSMPVLTRFGDITNPNLAEGPRLGLDVNRVDPLWIGWEPGNGDYVVFSLTPGTGTLTRFAKLRCVTIDDGCLEIPGPALGHLALDKATNFDLKLTRHNVEVWSKREGDDTVAGAMIDASASLAGTVQR